MLVLPLEIPEVSPEAWENLSSDEKKALTARLRRAFRAFLFEKDSDSIRQFMQGRGPYQTSGELNDNIS